MSTKWCKNLIWASYHNVLVKLMKTKSLYILWQISHSNLFPSGSSSLFRFRLGFGVQVRGRLAIGISSKKSSSSSKLFSYLSDYFCAIFERGLFARLQVWPGIPGKWSKLTKNGQKNLKKKYEKVKKNAKNFKNFPTKNNPPCIYNNVQIIKLVINGLFFYFDFTLIISILR